MGQKFLGRKQHYYAQVKAARAFDIVRQAVESMLAPVRASGRGTAADPTSYWFEVEIDAQETAKTVKDRFLALMPALSGELQRLQPVPGGTGKTMARQLELF